MALCWELYEDPNGTRWHEAQIWRNVPAGLKCAFGGAFGVGQGAFTSSPPRGVSGRENRRYWYMTRDFVRCGTMILRAMTVKERKDYDDDDTLYAVLELSSCLGKGQWRAPWTCYLPENVVVVALNGQPLEEPQAGQGQEPGGAHLVAHVITQPITRLMTRLVTQVNPPPWHLHPMSFPLSPRP